MTEMPEKSASQLTIFGPIRRAGLLAGLTFAAVLILWSFDYSAIINVDVWRYPRDYLSQKLVFTPTPQTISPKLPSFASVVDSTSAPKPHVNSSSYSRSSSSSSSDIITTASNLTTLPEIKNLTSFPDEVKNLTTSIPETIKSLNTSLPEFESLNISLPEVKNSRTDEVVLQQPGSKIENTSHELGQNASSSQMSQYHHQNADLVSDWISLGSVQNYTSNLMSMWTAPAGEPCKDADTQDIRFLSGINEDGKKLLKFSTADVHRVSFQAVDGAGNPRCLGGDYFEIDLSGESWKSRPPMKDHGNGTYSFEFQVHPDFAGDYNLTIILLFGHFKGLKYSPTRFIVDKLLRRTPVTLYQSSTKLPELHTCGKSDFERDLWAGRWTRHGKNDSCQISDDGRFRCFKPNYPCQEPWCKGPLGLLESNGWVYSAHCSFKLFMSDEAWNVLDKRWILLWGDSNHVDTTRNLLFFFLGIPELEVVTRRFDKAFVNPRNASQSVRFTNIFNGHWDDKGNYLGLDSLLNQGYRETLMSYFNGTVVPDTLIFNSGLHDGVYWPNVRRFVGGAERAAAFFAELMEAVRKNGLKKPNFIFRSTVTTGGHARKLAFNPSKMETFNGILLEKLRNAGLVTQVIDDFDMTWAWHFENRCNDGVHYGRFPAKLKWTDGQIGHQYFVDLMLGHVLLNAIHSSS